MSTRRAFLRKGVLVTTAVSAGFPLISCNRKAGEIPFRISLNTSTIRPYDLPVEQQIEFCGKAGFDGIELWMSDIQDYMKRNGPISGLAAILKNSGLILENVIGFAPWSADDDESRRKGVEQLRSEMEIIRQLGGKYVAAPFMGVRELNRSDMETYARRYREILELGKNTGVTPLLELWGSGVLHKLSDAATLCIIAEHPDANLLLDFYHLYRGGNSFDGLNMLNVARMPLFHINDYPSAPSRESLNDGHRVYPGDGICPFDKIMPILFHSGFRGAFSVELFNKSYCENHTVEEVLADSLIKTRETIKMYRS